MPLEAQKPDVNIEGGTTAVTSSDGALASIGSTTDAAATGNGSLIAVLKRVRDILQNVWDSVNGRLKVDASGVTQPVSIIDPLPVRPTLKGVASPRRYGFSRIVSNNPVQLNMLVFFNPSGQNDKYIHRLVVIAGSGAAGTGDACSITRITAHSGGTSQDVGIEHRKNTDDADSGMQVIIRPTSVTLQGAGGAMISFGGRETTGTNLYGPRSQWEAIDYEDRIRLKAGEGIAVQKASTDADDFYVIGGEWEET